MFDNQLTNLFLDLEENCLMTINNGDLEGLDFLLSPTSSAEITEVPSTSVLVPTTTQEAASSSCAQSSESGVVS